MRLIKQDRGIKRFLLWPQIPPRSHSAICKQILLIIKESGRRTQMAKEKPSLWSEKERGLPVLLTLSLYHCYIRKNSHCCLVPSVVSDSVRPLRLQPTRLHCPWDSPGKNTGVGCHFLLQCVKVKSEREVAQSRPHGLQSTRLLHPWDFPGKSTGVGCQCLLPRTATNL